MIDSDGIRSQFPILSTTVGGKPLIYLDSGATAQRPRRVTERMDWMTDNANANIHRAVHYLSDMATNLYEAARDRVGRFLNAAGRSEVVFTSGATAAINTVAHSFGERYVFEGDNVIVCEFEHHSNIVPWQLMCARRGAELRVLPFDDHGRLKVEMLDELIDGRTRLLAVTQASNVLGTCPDLKPIIARAHAQGAAVLVDGCQGVVHNRVDVRELDCDFYVFSGHKLYGPTGIGVLYAKERLLEEMPPFMGGGDMVNTVTFSGSTWAELPLKFEAGTANYVGAVGLAEAVEFVDSLDRDAVYSHEHALTQNLTRQLDEIGGLTVYGTQPGKCPIVSFGVDGVHPLDIGTIVDKMGVAIRTGTHCAQPVMAHYGVSGMCRVSFGVYNTHNEVDMFVESLRRALKMLR